MLQRAMWILWPSFIVGGVAETLFFALFDPHDLHWFGEPLPFAVGRTRIHGVGGTRVVFRYMRQFGRLAAVHRPGTGEQQLFRAAGNGEV